MSVKHAAHLEDLAKAYDNAKPRVVMQTHQHRAVYDPDSKEIILETIGTDAIGGKYWTTIGKLPNTASKSGDIYVGHSTYFAILDLLIEGKK